MDTATQSIHLAEVAHIIAASITGPRGKPTVQPADRGSYDNLILLCPTCHTMIDKASVDFPDAMLREWKRKRVERLAEVCGSIEYPDRILVRKAIESILNENAFVFEEYGPDNDYRDDPESELARVWQRKMKSVILPNNRKLLNIADANRGHLNATEVRTLEEFRQHVEDLEVKHLGDGGTIAHRFPIAMKTLFLDAADAELHRTRDY